MTRRSNWPERVAARFANVVEEITDDRHLRSTQFNGVTFALKTGRQFDSYHCVMEHTEADAVASLSDVKACDCDDCAADAKEGV